MSNPNRAFARASKRSPVATISCRSLTEAQDVAEAKRAEGFDARATSLKIGPRPKRRSDGTWSKQCYTFTVYVYNKLGKD